ncbi:peptide ABC transporter substrate-binding protein [Bifidobacterium scardovii]|uniref:ABC transporter substrate-binding protein n=2 Tax=Bifidobacterium scardovii TaxID=158787 RepID=A0A087DG76_9BIFI|nr:ABC transporter substrate-binding protein [Bifidobacterium scardovii]KFI94526.1 ABC transporter substrate-binding protein [Bifidobacterium scardovii]MDK6349259.1 ABC transporter substrate-binding protein [Bifidobacterium scardovii]BAQ31847.1 putative ABC transporter substrate binding component [Bifidobacterium scardovii JCM 12489 = DSM 13734]
MALGGCGSSSNKGADASAGNTITAMNAEPASGLLPGNTNSTTGGKVLDLIFSQLVAFDSKGKPVNEVAKEIKSNDDATQFTITIKDGWKFTDGTPVTAESFTKAWSYAANVTNAQINANFFSNIKGYDKVQQKGVASDEQLEGLKVVDDHTFTVDLSTSDSNFPIKVGYTGFAPLPESFYKDPKAFGENPVGNGAYKFKKWEHNKEIDVVKNPDYKGSFPAKNDGVNFMLYTSPQAAYADVLSGNLDVMDTVPSSVAGSLKTAKGVQVYNEPGSSITMFVITQDYPHFGPGKEGQLRRQAISMAINRQNICDKIMAGLCTPATDFSAPAINGHSDSLKGADVLKYNPDKAKELWAEADKISPWSGKFEIAYNSDGGLKDVYDAVINSIKNTLGIDAATLIFPTSSELSDVTDGRTLHKPHRMGWSPDYPSVENYLTSLYSTAAADGNGANTGDYKNPDFDALLAKGNAESSTDAAIKDYQAAEEILLQDLPTVPLFYTNANGVANKDLKNFEFNWQNSPLYRDMTKQ